ncbi:MAG TPA: hypothetical protein VFD92_04955 [Candidatus Binatia bacterium]|nr:hypothetical protein [Candidatus Binatia bacterium]
MGGLAPPWTPQTSSEPPTLPNPSATNDNKLALEQMLQIVRTMKPADRILLYNLFNREDHNCRVESNPTLEWERRRAKARGTTKS